MFAADRFHPSSAGYAAIAAALTPYVLDAARARRDAAA
jgi:lysophospholipase L1-like esterase